jgi:Flp pilus assembly protein TadG
MICFGNILINTLHKGAKDDDDDDNNNNNINNAQLQCVMQQYLNYTPHNLTISTHNSVSNGTNKGTAETNQQLNQKRECVVHNFLISSYHVQTDQPFSHVFVWPTLHSTFRNSLAA